MDRYTMLYGTDQTGRYVSFDATEGIGEFLLRIGAVDINATVAQVQNMLRGFETMRGYEDEAEDNKPVSVRYAPMHLYKLPGMPSSLQPFSAIAVNGRENKEGRNSIYTHTTLISQEDMLRKDGLNYLDQLFGVFYSNGGRWFSDKDMNLVREEKFIPDFKPTKVPVNDMPDLATAVRVVEHIYNDQNVILKLEYGCSFNRRAVEILTQIYSLLQPRLAFEVGFSAYQDPVRIGDLKNTSIRIFLIPASADAREFGSEFVLIDLNEKQPPLKRTPMALALVDWSKLDWHSQRQPSMNLIFEDTVTDFQNPELFVDRSKAFLEAAKELSVWARDSKKKDSVRSLQELQAEYDVHKSLWSLIPWGEETFRKQIPFLMGKNEFALQFSDLLGQCYIAERNGNKVDPEQINLLRFCKKMGSIDERELCEMIWSDRDQYCSQQLTEKEIDHLAEIKRIKEEHEIEDKAKQEAYEIKLRHSEESYTEKLKQCEEALEEQRDVNQALTRKHNDEIQAHKHTKQQLQTAAKECEDAIAKRKAMESKFQPLSEECTKAKQDLFKKEEELEHLKEKYRYRKKELEGLKKRIDQGSFLDRLPRWLPLLACFLIGAMLCGMIWLISNKSKTNGDEPSPEESAEVEPEQPGDNGDEEKEPPKKIVHLDELNELIAEAKTLDPSLYTEDSWKDFSIVLEQVESVKELNPSEEVTEEFTQALIDALKNMLQEARFKLVDKPIYSSKWEDPVFQDQIKNKFPELQFLNPLDYELPAPFMGNEQVKLAAVFSFTKESPESEAEVDQNVQGQEQTNETKEAEDGAPQTLAVATENSDSETQKKEELPCAIILEGDLTEYDLKQIENASVVASVNDQNLVVFSEEDILQATRVFAYSMSLPGDTDEATDSVTPVTTDSASTGNIILLYQAEHTWLDLAPDANNKTWWYSIIEWSTEEENLSNAGYELNTKSNPIMVIRSDSFLVGIFNYGDNAALATELAQAVQKDTVRAWQTGAFVVVQKDLTIQPHAINEDTGDTNAGETEAESGN